MIRTRGKQVTYGELWFDEDLVGPAPDILICRQRSNPWLGVANAEFTTSVIDLAREESHLFLSIRSATQYQIRRAEKKDCGIAAFFARPAPQLDEFCRFFNVFAESRGLKPAHRSWLGAACDAGMLALSNVERNGEVLVWHAYIVHGRRARLLHSASHFREQDMESRARMGRLNRMLHWRDIVEFKRQGFRYYDFGGIFSSSQAPSALGINRFKLDFGGDQSVSYDCTVPMSLKGKVYLALLRIKERFGKSAGK